MNRTRRVLFVRAAGAGGGGLEALETEFEVVVAENALDAMKRLSTEPTAPDCLVAPATPRDLTLETFLAQVARTVPDLPVVVFGEPPADVDDAAAIAAADAYVPAGREVTLADRVRRVAEDRKAEEAIERHARLERVVKTIAVEAAAASDRHRVETAVHDNLVGGQAYRHVWIAERSDDGTLDVSHPVSGRLGPEELGDLVGGGDPTFVSKATETGRVASTRGQVPTRSAASATAATTAIDGGETTALATAAVPFVRDGRVLGVTLVSTDRPNAFDGSERELLSDLGAVVGHALWALESVDRQAPSDPGRGMENLVHDLRNPLGIARSYLEIAREEETFDSIDRVESALRRMEETIDRVTEGVAGEPIDAAPGDLESAARAAWESVEASTASLAVTGSLTIRADRDLLIRLLANLFQNAVDHGGEDVTVRVGAVPGGFFVEDDGPGIPSDRRQSVFDRGYSTSEDGLGIGLSIVNDVAKAHGWSVAATAAETGGARFEVTGVERVEENETT